MNKLSLTMIVKNESKYLERCLNSVKNVVDEMIVVDTGSTDNTKEIAAKMGAQVYDFIWTDDFSAARNYAITKATGDWNLVLDADEYLVKGTRKNLDDFILNNKRVGKLKIISSFMQDNQVRYSQAFVSRLFPKGVYYHGRIHEQLATDLPRFNMNIEINHDGYLHNNKTDRNLKLLLLELEQNPKDPYFLYQTAIQYKLNKNYTEADRYFEACYKAISMNSSFRCNFVVDYLSNITLNKNLEQGLKLISKEAQKYVDYPDFHFACGIFYMELIFSDIDKYINLFSRIEEEYLTCLQIGDTDKYDSLLGTGSFLAAFNLGVFYETIGDVSKAVKYYKESAKQGYQVAVDRLKKVSK